MPTGAWQVENAVWDGQTLSFDVVLKANAARIDQVSCAFGDGVVTVGLTQSMSLFDDEPLRRTTVSLALPERDMYMLRARGTSAADVVEYPVTAIQP